jgi:cytoskeletal protein RodZ
MSTREPEAASSVGVRLREAREKRGLSLRQIADTTRISVMALEALERNDSKRLPGGIFTRAFVRAYAAEVGLDPEKAVQDFLAQFPNEPVFVVGPGGHVEDNEAVESERRIAETVVGLLLLSLPIAAGVVYFSMRGPSAPVAVERVVAADAGGATIVDEGEESVVEPAPPRPAPAIAAGAAAGALLMVIQPQSDCWVSPTIDGEKVPSQLLATGQRRELRATREILVTVGDGGGCAYTLNGRTGRPLGAQGEVVTRRITIENFRTYLE